MVQVAVTGAGGFVGSHVAESFAARGHNVLALDNLSRTSILGPHLLGPQAATYNWNFVAKLPRVATTLLDVRDADATADALAHAEVIVHAAGQVAVTKSMVDPRTDFEINAVGTLNVLEGARKSSLDPVVLFCSTNKVYGGNVNRIPLRVDDTRYAFDDPDFENGIPETFNTDGCEHTPYGASKLAADLYVQEYARSYGLKTGVFRMSCIYGPRQFGVEDQGWVAHFAISSVLGRPITIYGDGKQVRDVLYVDDLVRALVAFLEKAPSLRGRVFNVGGGPSFTLSLLELRNILEKALGRKVPISFSDWRPADQKVYISDIRRIREQLSWMPELTPAEGVGRILKWVSVQSRTQPRIGAG